MADKQAGDLFVDIQGSTQGVSKSLNNIIKKLEKLQTTIKGIDTTNISKMTSALNFGSVGKGSSARTSTTSRNGTFGFLNVARWGAILYSARRMARVVGDIAQSGADYTETLNLWETAMGTNITLATEFVNKMNEAYGISEKTLMNAQATFKNMLGGLGNITDQMAYALSEGITQMAVDYASLYNQTFEQAFTKFQAALAAQVRPIRSVSGFDITEQTLFSLYQGLGGEKTMRQLNRTEKQLLSILAIFQQMSATGAVGDLNKTMDSFANQSRVMAESWKQVLSYAGILVTHTIQVSGLLTYVNATLIFIGDTLKAVVESVGAIQSFADPFQAVTDGALTASKATDQLNGKLLDFDKFRSLSGAEQNARGLDERLLQAFSNFDSILAGASMEARNLAENLKIVSGLFNEDGTFNVDRWEKIVDTIEMFGHALFAIVSTKVIFGIINGIKAMTVAGMGLQKVLVFGVILAILQAIDAFRDGEYAAGIIATTIGVALVGAIILLKLQQHKATVATEMYTASIIDNNAALALNAYSIGRNAFALKQWGIALASAVVSFALFDSIISGLDGTARKTVSIITIVTGALATMLGVILAIKGGIKGGLIGASIAGLGVGALLAGIKGVATKSSKIDVTAHKNGGLPDKGTMFLAGEAGAEIVYNNANGQSGVANIQQIKSAMYQALVEYGSSHSSGGNEVIVVKIGEEEVFRATRKSAKRQGLDFVKV